MEEQFVSVHVSKQQIIAVTSSCKLCSFNAQGVAIDTWVNPDEQSIQSCHIFPFDPIDRVIHVVVIDDLGGAFWLLHVEPFGFIELKSLTSGEGQRTKCDNISSSLNGTIICASLSSQTDSWVNVWRIPGQISAQWKKEIDSQPEATLSETGSLEEPLEPADASTYKWKPTLSFNAPPIKLKKPKHTIQPKRTSYAELKSAVDHEADVTGDENVYLLSDEMKTQRTETEEKSFKLNFPSEPIPTEEELAIELNSPCTVRVLDPVTSHSGETAGSRAGSRTGSGKMKRYSVAVSQPNATKLFIYSLVQKTPSGKVTPFVALPHTDKITTFTVDTVTTHYIATCCANGTITLWRRDSETHIVPVYVAPALNKVSCDLIFLSQPDNLQIPPVLIALDRAKTLFAIRHDQNKFLNVFNKRQEIFEGVQVITLTHPQYPHSPKWGYKTCLLLHFYLFIPIRESFV